ncbi:MAG: hypothetical protein ABH860_01530 [bacterium]
MRKYLFLLLLVVFASGWSPANMVPAFNNLKANITTQLNELFDREISVESISGTFINQIELNNVSIAKEKKLSEGSVIKAKKIIINYNPFKLVAAGGNIVPAISKIVIIEPEVLVERSSRDEWNMASLMPKNKPLKKGEQPAPPLLISGKVIIKGGHGLYVDHMGWGEDLKGRPFTSQIKDLDAEIKLFGSRLDLSATATSVIDKSTAYTRTTGNLNVKTGKYRFVVTAKNVDMEKWGYYTLNIPHFKPISGISDMKLTMTNPPPRKGGLPVFFDGQFYIKDGKAMIFDRLFEGMNGFVGVHDEDAKFRNLTGYRDKVPVTANGRLYDFTVANYDINLDVPKNDFKKISRAFPELSGIDFYGKASASLHVGGNYGHPVFNGSALADGELVEQKLTGKFNFSCDGPVLQIDSDNILAYKGRIYAKSIVDFTPSVPVFSVNISGEGLSLKDVLPVALMNEGASLQANINGSIQKFNIKSTVAFPDGGEISGFGTVEANNISMLVSGSGLMIARGLFHGKMNSFTGKLYGNVSNFEKDLALDGDVSFSDSMVAVQPVSDIDASFKFRNGKIDIASLVLSVGSSQISIKGETGLNCMTDLTIEAASAEASDIKILRSFLPKELTPVSGKLDAHFAVSGKVTSETNIDPGAFTVTGDLRLKDGFVAYESFNYAAFKITWANSGLNFKDSRIRTDSSDILFDGTIEANGKLDLNISGTLELADLRPITLKYGRLSGSSKLTCHLEGKADNPSFSIRFDGSNLRYNEIIIDQISGRIIYDGTNIFLIEPLDINQANNECTISGSVSLLKKPLLSLRFAVLKGDLNTAVELFDKINSEIGTKQLFGISEKQKTIVLYPGKFQLPGRGTKLLYKSGGNRTTVEEIKKAESESAAYGKAMKERSGRQVEGKFLGFLEVKGNIDNLSGALDFVVSGGTWESYAFDEAGIRASLENGTFEVSSAYIKKGSGTLSAYGFFNPLTSASLEIAAENMPIDFLSLFMGRGKSFDGKFNMSARIYGPVSTLSGSASIEALKISIGGVDFDRMTSVIDYSSDTLYFKKAELAGNDRKATISGKLPLNKDGIFLNITMEGESLGLLTLASPDISWISGAGKGVVKITGNLDHPQFNGNLLVNNAAVNLRSIGSNLESINTNITIKNNTMSTESLSAKWTGKWTQNVINKIKLYGSVGWDELFSEGGSLDLDIKLKDGDFTVDLPNLYKGDLEIKNFSLAGPFHVSKGKEKSPKLSGIFNLSNGVLTLPDMTKKTDLPPLNLDMVLNIQKNSYVAAGDTRNLISTDLSNLILNLELEGQNIAVSGSLESPKILGKTTFKRGTVNILSREFSLMTEDRQKEIFTSDLDLVKENSAVFKGGDLPSLMLSAEIKVKSMEKTSASATKTPEYAQTNMLVVSRITGTPFSKEKEEGLNLAFYAYKEDSSKQPPELVPSGYDEQEIKVLLLPDFIKGPLGISERGVADVDANEVLADYLNSRLNAYLLRSVERDLAKNLDLESMTLEYNFGKDLKNMLPTTKSPTEISPQEMPETMYGIGAVKGFFGRLYIDVKYSQAVQEQAVINKAFLNYQLTYKLSPVLSVVYYREPFSFIEEESDYYKVTLKAGYQL